MATFAHEYAWLIGAFHPVDPLVIDSLILDPLIIYGASVKLSRLFSCFTLRTNRMTKVHFQPKASMDAVRDPRERKSKCLEKLQL